MGTSIVATLLTIHAGHSETLHLLARFMLLLAWAMAVGLICGFVRQRSRSLRNSTQGHGIAHWGMVAMGLLALGSATATVYPTAPTWRIDAALWAVGTALGWMTTAIQSRRLLATLKALIQQRCPRYAMGKPTAVWGLAVVPPMVSATTGAALASRLPTGLGQALLVIVGFCFMLALVAGGAIFAVTYLHYWNGNEVPLEATTSVWIPLGIVGQSSAAAIAIATAAQQFLPTATAATLLHTAVSYAVTLLAIGMPLAGWALVITIRGFARHMPFTPGWWSLTFPIGTVCLGLHALSAATHLRWLNFASQSVLVALGISWLLCATTSLGAILRHRLQVR